MDPDEVLAQLRQAILLMHEAESDAAFLVSSCELLNAAEAMDGWLSRGGFLPKGWTPSGVRT